jgi:zinc transporter 5/7
VFFYFTIFKLNKLPGFFFFLHALLLVSYVYFYTEEIKFASGLDENLSISQEFRREDSLVYDFLKTCYENNDSRKIAIFFTINLLFMFVELIYGYMSNSLGLITDSFHMLFDCMALFIGLCASYIAKMGVNR